MTCQDFVEFLMQYLDRELPEDQRRTFEERMRLCPPCLTYLDQYQETVKLGKSVCDAENRVPDDAPEELVRAILTALEGRPARS